LDAFKMFLEQVPQAMLYIHTNPDNPGGFPIKEYGRFIGIQDKLLFPDTYQMTFNTNKEGMIRFGLGGIKGVGDAAIQSIIEEREKNGPYLSIYDFVERVNLRTVNKKTMECLAQAGSFDCFSDIHRAQFFYQSNGDATFIEKLARYANAVIEAKSSAQVSLFGGAGGGTGAVARPALPTCEPWDELDKLRLEKEVIGFYISGHPLDQYRVELDNFCSCTLDRINDYKDKDVSIGGRIAVVNERVGKNGNKFAIFTIEDYGGRLDIMLFAEAYLKHAHFLVPGQFLYIKGRYQESKYRPGLTEFKVASMSLLSEVREKFCRGLKVSIGLKDVNDRLLKEVEQIFEKNKGNGNLKVLIKEPETNISLELFSRKYRINPSNELMDEIRKMPGVEVEILK
ncbi:MAG: DNA polymerase III subunit alpha, partial [Cytophagales bacterium]|nr:DNA polymerase III subunit alpha [Cytophagales bacterium]